MCRWVKQISKFKTGTIDVDTNGFKVAAKISFSFPGDRRGSEVLEELADCQNGEELVTSI